VPSDKLVLLGNGVDLRRFRPSADDRRRRQVRAGFGIDDDVVVAGTVARLVWQKGFRELFAAAERLRDTQRDVVFVVVGGSDPDKADAIPPDQLEVARRRGRIVFAGSRDDVENIYAAFDLFVLPSHREGFPRSAMEAAACGLPVIATDIRGCREVVSDGQSGLLIPLRDPERLASAVEKLVDAPALRRQMGSAGRRKAEAEFDDRAVVSKTLEAYERVLMPANCSARRRTLSSATRPSYRSR
jgi:glycosyltransferase involved in cell wall biosynthesis